MSKAKLSLENLKATLDKTDSKHIGMFVGLLGMALQNRDITLEQASALFEEIKLRYM